MSPFTRRYLITTDGVTILTIYHRVYGTQTVRTYSCVEESEGLCALYDPVYPHVRRGKELGETGKMTESEERQVLDGWLCVQRRRIHTDMCARPVCGRKGYGGVLRSYGSSVG